ncbi:DnaD domain protein [Brevibacillus sp. MCWH]|mgnify:CR=1 FL=1|uniref:DnaD domain protein n=1 Tax=Brevibacillus sp. MCWH TaxID=2508871 RepID=UPI001492B291|nr:hypothetical protein [Brevibacillus sp. MCWH]
MNYIRELNAFVDWLETNPLEATAQTLWFHLMAIANKSGWPEWFAVSNLTLQAKLSVTENTLAKHRNTLVQKGRIEYRSQGKQKAGKYRIIPFSAPNLTAKNEVNHEKSDDHASKIAADREVLHEANLAEKREVNHEALYKQNKTKRKTNFSLEIPVRENFLSMINELNIKCRGVWDIDALEAFVGIMEPELIREALKRSEMKSVAYAIEILRNWHAEKIHTVQVLREHEGKRRSRLRGYRGNVVLMDKLPASIQWQQEQERLGVPMQPREPRTVADDPELAEMLRDLHRSKKAGS